MNLPALFEAGVVDVVSPIAVGFVYIMASSLLAEPQRRNFNAVMIAGAGAAYLNGGFGIWEFGFTGVLTYLAYRGLGSYRFIAIGWLLHSGWDVLHDLYGNPIIPFAPTSSLGCAICDPVIALWCFAGAPSVFDLLRRSRFFAR
jgi:cytochrome c biogenesis protein CcdA